MPLISCSVIRFLSLTTSVSCAPYARIVRRCSSVVNDHRKLEFEVPDKLHDLLLWAHSARIPSLRQQPFDEVEALLRLGQLLSQLAHFEIGRASCRERV